MKLRVLLAQLHEQGESSKIIAELVEGISQLHKTDNFHFVHLLTVIYDADQARIDEQSFGMLVDYILSFMQQNKQSINHSLIKDEVYFEKESFQNFNLTKFLIHCYQ